ncbi:iron-sulfur cluster assembly accessory protein [Aromatoleum toluolicum]|uniref:Iron-sulfur cluster assembly accessory protein n=1 Tax=Aromatoleum toluolicum TaxID=90060 RepID=A0ABX1NDU7_9RHOO|nr:iron-sulfur cluster assembly accessory protein [Aromatoleum toluolicum]NMF97462.1 iron-sulfur cluster assembly accessory protein [Aromatoleum toluolicum]
MCVTLTPAAAGFMKRIVRFGGGSADSGFRLSVKPGGCSGFDSSFTVETAPAAGDAVIEQLGVRLFLTEDSCALLRGYTVDFTENSVDSRLSYHKEGAAEGCGCGSGTGAQAPGAAVAVKFFKPGSSCTKA